MVFQVVILTPLAVVCEYPGARGTHLILKNTVHLHIKVRLLAAADSEVRRPCFMKCSCDLLNP